jgi:hypothetical protein
LAEEKRLVQRVYLASQYRRRDELRTCAAALERLGFEITSRWLAGDQPLLELGESRTEAEAAAIRDLHDVRSADIFVAFTEHASAPSKGRGGRHVEFGVALALERRLLVVGPPEHVFHLLPSVEQYPTWDEALEALALRS